MLFVDIDGVLSLFGFPPDAVPNGTWTQVDGIAHLLSATAAAHLQALTALFEPVWCTGWEDRANDHLPHLLGLGPFEHLTFVADEREHWKIAAVEARAADRAMAWIDDDLNEAVHAWARARGAPTLLVDTDPALGLDDAAAGRLADFARAVGGEMAVLDP